MREEASKHFPEQPFSLRIPKPSSNPRVFVNGFEKCSINQSYLPEGEFGSPDPQLLGLLPKPPILRKAVAYLDALGHVIGRSDLVYSDFFHDPAHVGMTIGYLRSHNYCNNNQYIKEYKRYFNHINKMHKKELHAKLEDYTKS